MCISCFIFLAEARFPDVENICIWLKPLQYFDAKWAELVSQGKGENMDGNKSRSKGKQKRCKPKRNKARYVEHVLQEILDLHHLSIMELIHTDMGGVRHASFGNHHPMPLF